jgi:DNA mismatch repair protein MLH3
MFDTSMLRTSSSAVPPRPSPSIAGLPSARGSVARAVSREALGELRALGQVERKFIAATAHRQLFLIDQHAADERVQLEHLHGATVDDRGMPTVDGIERRRIRPSRRVAAASHELSLLNAHAARLYAWGWEFHSSASGEVRLECLPAVQGVELGEAAMVEFAQALHDTAGGSTLPPPAASRVLASTACRRAVMFGSELSMLRCQEILSRLARCAMPFQCAHGRPTIAPVLDLDALQEPN